MKNNEWMMGFRSGSSLNAPTNVMYHYCVPVVCTDHPPFFFFMCVEKTRDKHTVLPDGNQILSVGQKRQRGGRNCAPPHTGYEKRGVQ